ncbi:MAG: YceI family protein [Candidatus Rokubacteria bacterium]|nr:YceI family protein [Candidatus Rokubacteria bacterium]
MNAPARAAAAILLGAAGLGLSSQSAGAEPARFRIEPGASEITFKATSRLMNADGRFHRFSGEVVVDPDDLATARVTLVIDAASIDTDIARRDSHLRSEDFFHVERYPTITFESVRIEPRRSGGTPPTDSLRRASGVGRPAASHSHAGLAVPVTIIGRLTLRGVTREIAVPVEVRLTDGALVARGELSLKRSDYAITYQSFLNPIADVVRVAFTFRGRAGL